MKRFIVEIADTEIGDDALRALLVNAIPGGPLVTAALQTIAADDIVAMARERHCEGSDNEIEIDEPANASYGEDGAWVAGWLFVPRVGPEYTSDDEG